MESLEGSDKTASSGAVCELSPNSVVSDSNKFYITDLLEQLDEMGETLLQQARCLKTPMKPDKQKDVTNEPILGFRLENIFNATHSIPPRHPSSSTQLNHVVTANLSPYKRKSEAIGNGWNAKGLQKAKAGQWEEAILCWENALEIRLQVLGKDHPDVANTLNNMGIALGRLEEYDDAMICLNRALKIRTAIHGKTHLEIAATYHNIGNVFQQMKDYDSALKSFEEARATQLLLKEDLLVARTCNAMGHLHFEYQKFDDALACFTEARANFTKAGYGEGDDEYDAVLMDIADTELHEKSAVG
jgi:tetratricopeptide (TPR) repeat protein